MQTQNQYTVRSVDGKQIALSSLDLLLCSGTAKESRLIIRYQRLMGAEGTAAEISHVAGIVESPYFEMPRVAEATTLNKWANKSGFQINDFDRWLENYPGRVWVRQMMPEYTDPRRAYQEALRQVGTPYENGIPGFLELAFCGIEWQWFRMTFRVGKRLETKSLHCTENKVQRLQSLGLVLNSVNANKMPPYQFWPGGKLDKNLVGCIYGEPVQLK